MLERSTSIPWRDGQVVPLPKDPAVPIRGGAIVCADANGLAVPGRADPGLAFIGVAECEAVSGERAVLVRRNVDFLLRFAPEPVAALAIGRPCWIVDDEFVAASDGGGTRPAAGIVTGIEPGRIWVRGEAASALASGSGSAPELLHSPAAAPAVERMGPVPGRIRGSAALDIADLSPFTAVSAGTIAIGGVEVGGIDLSAAATINEVVDAISAAVQARLPEYSVGLDYINPNFYGRILHYGGDVPAIGGTLEPLFGFAAPAARAGHVAASPDIVLSAAPSGRWRSLSLRFTGQAYRSVYWHCRSDFWESADGLVASWFLLDGGGAWRSNSLSAGADAAELQVAELVAYRLAYYEIFYHPAERRISWRPARELPSSDNWAPSIDTLVAIGS